MGKIPEKCLCAHVYDAVNALVDERHMIDAFVSSIYNNDRTIPICKEIAYLAKSIVAESEIDLQEFHHLPLKTDRDGKFITSKSGIPELRGNGYQLLNKLIHMPPSRERDKALILMTKLHGYVEPLHINDGIRRTVSMIENIETRIEPIFNWDGFRLFVDRWMDLHPTVQSFDWKSHIRPLHLIAEETLNSSKKKPTVKFHERNQQFFWDNEASKSDEDSYKYAYILGSKEFRELYETDKVDFDRLVTNRLTLEVTDDTNLYAYQPVHTPVGRQGIRLQEAEKVRVLWMPHPLFESLLNPMVVLLERLVEESPFQTAYDDDAVAAAEIRRIFFHNGERSDDELFSIDQSNYTDNFPYKLQRIVIEVLVEREILPNITLPALDLMVQGGYLPMSKMINENIWTKEIHFANGTPMGGDGLWMLSTLTHQLLVEYLQEQMGKHTPFKVQGDDAILKGRDLFERYRSTLSDLGCSINLSKTMISTRAVEYCGFISTYEQSVPMFRPHNRFKDSVRDLFSDRAVESYGTQQILNWVMANRPSDLLFLQITGIIPVSEDDDDYIFISNGKDILRAMHAKNEILDAIESREQQARYYEYRQYWPHVNEEEPDIELLEHRSDYRDYLIQIKKVMRLWTHLLTNPTADICKMTTAINTTCQSIKDRHSDFLSGVHSQKRKSAHDARCRSPVDKKTEEEHELKTVAKALDILNNNQNSHNKGGHQYDDYSL